MAVVAGPGYGKTAFIGYAFASADLPGAYLALSPAHRDPAGFLEALADSLAGAHEGLGRAASERLRECLDVEQEVLSVMAAVVEEMAAVPSPTYLALDDLSEVEDSSAVTAAVCFLAETLPPGWTLFLASRRPLPCDLESARLHGRVVDIGLRRLRFTPGEIVEWAAQKWELDLGRDEARGLWKVTEGWPVALALLSERYRRRGRVRVREDVVRLLRQGERLQDYLAGHVFELLAPAAAEVLLAAGLLPRVSFPRDEAYLPGPPGHAQALLDDLVDGGLLVTETRHQTYLLHPLLRAYARHRLADLGDAMAARMLVAAGRHLEESDELLEAVSLYLEAGEPDAAVAPLRLHVSRHLNAASTFACREWLSLLPEPLARDDPWFALARGRVLHDEGRFAEAEQQYRAADRGFIRSSERSGRLRALLGQAFCLFVAGRWEDSVQVTEEAERVAEAREERAEVLATKGNVVLGQCRWDDAVELFEIALATAPPPMREGLEQRIFLFRARLFFLRGIYPTAVEWAERAVRRAGSGPRTTYTAALNTLATLHYLQGAYEDAGIHAENALALIRTRGYAYLEGPALLSLAGVYAGVRDYCSALGCIKQARELSRTAGDGEAEVWALDMQADVCRRNRNARRALELRDEAEALIERLQLAEFERLRVRAGLGLDQAVAGEEAAAAATLQDVVSRSRQAGVAGPLLTSLFYLGWLAAKEGDERAAARHLKESLELAGRHRHLHFLLQEAAVATPILALAVRLGAGDVVVQEVVPRLPARLRDYFDSLAYGDVYPSDVALGSPRGSREELARGRRPLCSSSERELIERFDRLTDREFEILRYIASGLPNKVIAARLFITEKTIKTHANRVYRKLEVSNRLQAVLALQQFDGLVRGGYAPPGRR